MKIALPRKVPFTFSSVILLYAALAGAARASVAIGNSDVQVGGFFSQGWLYGSDNNYPTEDKGGTWDFRQMALNVSDPIGSHLRVGAQIFAQSFGNIGEDKVILDWAIADYNFNEAFGIRAGRVKYPKGLYGEALDLDAIRPFVFLPGSVYSPILRDFSASFDGAMIYGTFNVGKGSLDYKVFGGNIPMSPSQGVAEFYNNSGLYADPGVGALAMDSVEGGQLAWNTPVSGLKFVYSYSVFDNLSTDGSFAGYPPINLHSNMNRFTWTTLSSEYSWNDWTFAAEWQRTGSTGFTYSAPPFVPTQYGKEGWDGWYVSAAKRLFGKWQVGAYYSHLSQRFSSSTPQKDIALSVAYDVNDHIIVKIEGHSIDGTYQTFDTVRIVNPAPSNSTNVFAAKMTVSF